MSSIQATATKTAQPARKRALGTSNASSNVPSAKRVAGALVPYGSDSTDSEPETTPAAPVVVSAAAPRTRVMVALNRHARRAQQAAARAATLPSTAASALPPSSASDSEPSPTRVVRELAPSSKVAAAAAPIKPSAPLRASRPASEKLAFEMPTSYKSLTAHKTPAPCKSVAPAAKSPAPCKSLAPAASKSPAPCKSLPAASKSPTVCESAASPAKAASAASARATTDQSEKKGVHTSSCPPPRVVEMRWHYRKVSGCVEDGPSERVVRWWPFDKVDQENLAATQRAGSLLAPIAQGAATAHLGMKAMQVYKPIAKYHLAVGDLVVLADAHLEDQEFVDALISRMRRVYPLTAGELAPNRREKTTTPVPPDSAEFKEIAARVRSESKLWDVKTVEAVWSPEQNTRYEAERTLLRAPYAAMLWHGTSDTSPHLVALDGVDPRYSSSGNLYGKASYFATNIESASRSVAVLSPFASSFLLYAYAGTLRRMTNFTGWVATKRTCCCVACLSVCQRPLERTRREGRLPRLAATHSARLNRPL